MRILLRLVAVICALSVVATVVFIARFGTSGISKLVATGMFGLITLFGWLITLVAGSIAAVQLLRLKSTGRIAAAVLFGTMSAYYVYGLVGIIAFRQPSTFIGPVIAMSAFSLLLVVLVLSPAAKRACDAAA